jgi:hypothetical protein
MIAPGSIADWVMFAGMLGSLSAVAVGTHRFVLRETATPERSRSHPFIAPARAPNRVAK